MNMPTNMNNLNYAQPQVVPNGSYFHPGFLPQTSQQPTNYFDPSALNSSLLSEQVSQGSPQREIERLKKRVAELTHNLQYSYYVIYQLQNAIKQSNLANVAESVQLREKVETLQRENDALRKSLEEKEVKVDEFIEEKVTGGFNVNEMMNAVNRMLAAQNNAIYNKHWNFTTTNRSQPSPDSTVHEPDLQAWLTQQRQNCELWNQNFALKEYLRCIEQENYMLREMCRQRDMQISALRKRTEELNADLKFNSDIKRDIKQVSNAFHFKPAKDVEAESFKCTCGQC
ncbi:unnamed protein product [Nippostrongylus brasiliensis]|uniref:Uncharacterized protein n=1 Tax=Nippostrongylus brasiliensis TaxID=27835 RepID=A0A0N4XVX6_NIPBR|nr:unnamed protein product [Nippostrongylus brasiliensis]